MAIIKLVEITELFGDELGINIFQLLQAIENLVKPDSSLLNTERRQYLRRVLKELSEVK